MLTDVDYSGTIERVLTGRKSTMKILRISTFESRSPEKYATSRSNAKAPVELCARRAAFAASRSRSLLVATKYQ